MRMRKRRLEKSIEKSVIRRYKKLLITYLGDPKAEKDGPLKLNGMGRRAWPDRLFPGPYGRFVMIEFKRLGEEPTPAQAFVHKKLARLGHKVEVVDNVEYGYELMAKLFAKPAPAEKMWLDRRQIRAIA